MNGNAAFQRGFNMVMQMHGAKTQKEQIKKGLALRERATAVQEKLAKLREKQQDEEDRLRGIKAQEKETKEKEFQQFWAPKETGVPDFSPMAGPGETVQMPSMGEETFGDFANLAKMLLSTGQGKQLAPIMGQLKEKAPKTATTAMGQFLKMHPEANEKQLLAFAEKYTKATQRAGRAPTNAEQFIADMSADYKERTGKNPPPGERAKWRIEFQRATPFLQWIMTQGAGGGAAQERLSLEELHGETK